MAAFPLQSTEIPGFKIPEGSKILLIGKTLSGKTEMTKRLIKHREAVFKKSPERIICSFRFKQDWVDELGDIVEFIPAGTLPTDIDGSYSSLLIIDDLEEKNFESVSEWFIRNGRHLRCTVMVTYQALYANSSHYRVINQNADFLILFYTVRNMHQISLLGRELYGRDKDKLSKFIEIYNNCVARPHGYLLIDLTAGAPFRLRTLILPDDGEFQSVFAL